MLLSRKDLAATVVTGLAVAAIWTGSLTLLALLLADNVALWAVSTLRHTVHVRLHLSHRPLAQ